MTEAQLIGVSILAGVSLFALAIGLIGLRNIKRKNDDRLQRMITPTLDDAEESIRRIKQLRGWRPRRATRFYVSCLQRSTRKYNEATQALKADTVNIGKQAEQLEQAEQHADRILEAKKAGLL